MVSRKGRDAVVQHALLPSDSPLEKTPHKTRNGELSITCSDRHCPKCQSLARARWLQDRQAELLNTEYFHVVFTVPDRIATIAYQNKRELYGILFRAVAETLRTIATDPKHLGAEIGFFAVLHTWGSNLLHHPHLHCVATGGGLSGLPLSLEPKRTLSANLTFGRSERASDGGSKSLPARSRLVEDNIRSFEQGPHEYSLALR